ncbi:MAG: hypothetical protein IT428_25865 [Planctomycetaceae bacterium]|nr:hypothetical protein [Planctomycetaceae bacterium]
MRFASHLLFAVLACGVLSMAPRASPAAERTVPITIKGGHETDPKDGGRPVVLVAAGLGVKPEVFREAFRGVTPARNGRPTGEQARQNKAALLKVLGPHGITNDRLDEVSDYYRYRPQDGELWTHKDAKAHAVVVDGKVTKIVLDEPGAGYSSPPTATIQGMNGVRLAVSLSFGKDLKTNGSIRKIELAGPEKTAR